MKWLRLYHEARNDAKLESLTDAQFRVWFRLLCFANEQPERGAIQGMDDELLAVEVARGDTDLLHATLERLERLRIIQRGDGVEFVNWKKRNFESDNVTDRVRRHRETFQKRSSNDDETPPDTDSDSEPDSDSETDTEKDAEASARDDDHVPGDLNPPMPETPTLDAFYQTHFGHNMWNQVKLKGYVADGMEEQCVLYALELALEADARRGIRFPVAVLESWRQEGIITRSQAEEHERQRKGKARDPTQNGKHEPLTVDEIQRRWREQGITDEEDDFAASQISDFLGGRADERHGRPENDT